MKIYEDALNYVNTVQEELICLIEDLCLIPSFSFHEEKKAIFIENWLKKYDIHAFRDKKNNVIVPININENSSFTLFCAHIDTVFPDKIGFQCIKKDGYLYAPGVGDNTANVASLMLITRYLFHHKYDNCKCLIVFDVCEEGLGNLEGIRYIFKQYKHLIKEFYAFDLGYHQIITRAVGSIRYEVLITCEGGHSYSSFGKVNAIVAASQIIQELYDYQPPQRGKSTYNVGIIEGGNSVNSIAQEARFLFEYRSDNREDLKDMEGYFQSVIHQYKDKDFSIKVHVIGQRPCQGHVNQERMSLIINQVSDIITHFSSCRPSIVSASTDCNIPFSYGISGCCFGGYIGDGEHTRDERILISSLTTGMNIMITHILNCFE